MATLKLVLFAAIVVAVVGGWLFYWEETGFDETDDNNKDDLEFEVVAG
jgi:hypothetical protein